jgi:hypothetical protein
MVWIERGDGEEVWKRPAGISEIITACVVVDGSC